MRMFFEVVFILVLLYVRFTHSATAEDVKRLFQDKISKGNRKIRPSWNQSQAVDVEFTVYIVAVTDLNEVQQKVEATIWIRVQWMNELLTWNSSDYGNLLVVYPSVDVTWRPDLSISNGYNELKPIGLDYVNMKIFNDGRTIWTPGQKVEFLCNINVAKFPFDTQNCYMDFFNWGATEGESTLNYVSSDDMIEALHPNSEWTIIERRFEKLAGESHDTVRVRLIIKRKSTSMVLTVLLPVFLLSFLNIFVFLLPTESGEKVSFSVTVLLSQAVFLSYISGLMPQTSDSISSLSIYISAQLILSTLYVLLTCCILRVYHRNTTKNPLPSWFVKMFCHSPRNNVYPVKGDGNQKLVFDEFVDCGIQISKTLDRLFFWIFFVVVVFMTSYFTFEGLTS